MIKHNASQPEFRLANLGDIQAGRGNMGGEMPVLIFRMYQFAVRHVLVDELGQEKTEEIIREAGRISGHALARSLLDLSLDMDSFVAQLVQTLKDLKVGQMRLEEIDADAGTFRLSVAEDLDCSGLPVTNETICVYDEGLIAGVLSAYFKKDVEVRETECWATGARTCRFEGKILS